VLFSAADYQKMPWIVNRSAQARPSSLNTPAHQVIGPLFENRFTALIVLANGPFFSYY